MGSGLVAGSGPGAESGHEAGGPVRAGDREWTRGGWGQSGGGDPWALGSDPTWCFSLQEVICV